MILIFFLKIECEELVLTRVGNSFQLVIPAYFTPNLPLSKTLAREKQTFI